MGPRETEEAGGPARRIHGIPPITGVLRRQQIIFEDAGPTVIEEFAHHPTEFRPTLAGSKECHSGERIIAVFEPRPDASCRGSRGSRHQGDFLRGDRADPGLSPLRGASWRYG